MKKLYFLLMSFVIIGLSANAQNYTVDPTNDTLDVSVSWDYDTVFMDTTLVILDDVVLTIEPGTKIIFNDSYRFVVEGSLVAEGTETDTIYFTVADTAGYADSFNHLGWRGMYFNNDDNSMDDNDPSSFAYCHFSYFKGNGNDGILMLRHIDNFMLNHCDFENNYSDISSGAIEFTYVNNVTISECKFINNSGGYSGGAVCLYESDSCSFINCEFTDNYANFEGGALQFSYSKECSIIECEFNNNYSDSYGGALQLNYCQGVSVDSCGFEDNYGENYGGALQFNYSEGIYVNDCWFMNNFSNSKGGAIDLYECEGLPMISNSYFENNHSEDDGGAIKAGGYCSTKILHNEFINNYSVKHGGAIMSSGYNNNLIYGNLFKGNYSEYNGGAIKVAYSSSTKVINNTIVDNEAAYGGGGLHCGPYAGTLTMKNNIIANNTDSTENAGNISLYFGDGRIVDITHNNIVGGDEMVYVYGDDPIMGIYENNIDVDPLFTDAESNDYTLMCGSTCINAGVLTLDMPELDFYGEQRLLGPTVDLGIAEKLSLPITTLQPENFIACDNTTATYSCAADFASAYQWQVSTDLGSSWTYIVDDDIYSGTTTSQIDVLTNTYLNGNMYRCVITGPCEDAPTESGLLLVHSLPFVNLGYDKIIATTESIELDAGEFEDYLWSTDETSQTITVDGEVLGVGVYNYSVTVTDQNSCQGEDEIEITINDYTGVDDAVLAINSIYPNPSDGVFNVTATMGSTVQIVDITGKVLRTIDVSNTDVYSLDLSEFGAGIYYAKFTNDEESFTEKIIIR